MFVSASARKNRLNAAVGGVGMHIGPGALKSQMNIEKLQPRITVARLNGNPPQKSSPVTAVPMLVTKQTSSPSVVY